MSAVGGVASGPRAEDGSRRRRLALVTGASGGIGGAVSRALAASGWEVALAARRAEPLGALAREIAARGGRALALPTDLTREDEVERLVRAVDEAWGRLDLLVHAAGYGRFSPLAETSLAEWERTLAANLTAVFLLSRASLGLLARGHEPQIMALISVAARRDFAGNAAYGAAKAGLLGLVGVMREELRPRGIRVTALIPGATDTPFWDRAGGHWDRSRMMRPETVARLVVAAAAVPAEAAVEEITIRPAGGDL